MKVIVTWTGVTRIAYICDDVSLTHFIPFGETTRVACKVRVVKNEFLFIVQLIDGGSTTFALKQFQYSAAACCQHWSAGGRHNVDGIVHPAFRSRIGEGV